MEPWNHPPIWDQDVFSRSRPYDLLVVGAGIVGFSTGLFYKREHPEAEVGQDAAEMISGSG